MRDSFNKVKVILHIFGFPSYLLLKDWNQTLIEVVQSVFFHINLQSIIIWIVLEWPDNWEVIMFQSRVLGNTIQVSTDTIGWQGALSHQPSLHPPLYPKYFPGLRRGGHHTWDQIYPPARPAHRPQGTLARCGSLWGKTCRVEGRKGGGV